MLHRVAHKRITEFAVSTKSWITLIITKHKSNKQTILIRIREYIWTIHFRSYIYIYIYYLNKMGVLFIRLVMCGTRRTWEAPKHKGVKMYIKTKHAQQEPGCTAHARQPMGPPKPTPNRCSHADHDQFNSIN